MQKIQHLCDLCFGAGTDTVALHLGVQFGVDRNQMVVDLCDQDFDRLNSVLEGYFLVGRRPDTISVPKISPPSKPKGKGGPKPTPAGDFRCPVVGCPRTFTSNQGVSMHKTRVHQIPGIAQHGQEAHDAAVAAASAEDVAPATAGNTRIELVKVPTRAGMTEEQRERERERDRARKARKRDALRLIGS